MNSLFEYASSLSTKTKWHGNHDENEKSFLVKAGNLSMIYENGNLRNISAGNLEVIRMIYSAVRDKEWITILPVISEEVFDLHPDSFRIRYRCRHKSGNIDFLSYFTIEGNNDNSLVISFEGEAMNTFEKNRIGFCVLHPIEGNAGETCTIRHTNDDMEYLEFPRSISPHQPFRDIRSMKWSVNDLNCTIDFYGEVFETEDQRNWTDASYKTYCTPLNLPFPAKIHKGEKIRQKIELKVEGCFPEPKSNNDQIVLTLQPEEICEVPAIGICRSTRPEPLTEGEIRILKKLRFYHYRVDLYLFMTDWKFAAERALNEARFLEYPLEFDLFFDDNALSQSVAFIDWIIPAKHEIALINIFHKTQRATTDQLTDTVVPLLREALPGIKFGSGTNANFAQLNRNRPESAHCDYLSYSIHPQEHATDNTTLTENLAGQKYTAESAMQFAGGKGIWISSVNLKRRFNASITNYDQPSPATDLPPQVDSRLMSLFGACWTVGSLKYLIESGVKGITFYETVGERGIFQGDHRSRWPEFFPSMEGMIFPLFFVFDYLLRDKSFKIVRSRSSHPLKVESLIFSNGGKLKLIIVNYTLLKQKLFFKGLEGDYLLYQLNADSFSKAVCNENWLDLSAGVKVSLKKGIVLEPFSVNFFNEDF